MDSIGPDGSTDAALYLPDEIQTLHRSFLPKLRDADTGVTVKIARFKEN
jgi:hypothetical protein